MKYIKLFEYHDKTEIFKKEYPRIYNDLSKLFTEGLCEILLKFKDISTNAIPKLYFKYLGKSILIKNGFQTMDDIIGTLYYDKELCDRIQRINHGYFSIEYVLGISKSLVGNMVEAFKEMEKEIDIIKESNPDLDIQIKDGWVLHKINEPADIKSFEIKVKQKDYPASWK